METGKTPGSDGLPVEFYKVFWKDISKPLIRALNLSHDTGCLSIIQRRGIIKLIPKPHYIKNWRPLTLLKCDYKLAAKSIANRLKNVRLSIIIISYAQTGFIKGRFIGEIIRLRVRFFGRIRKWVCDPRSYGFFDTKETQNPKKVLFCHDKTGWRHAIYTYIRTILLSYCPRILRWPVSAILNNIK